MKPAHLLLLSLLTLVTLGARPLWAGPASASSSRLDATGNGAAEKAFDADLSTSWVEGGPGLGKGEWLELRLPRPRVVEHVTLFAGRFDSSRAFMEYGHAEKVQVSWTGKASGQVEVSLPDAYQAVRVPVGGEISTLKVTLLSSYDGSRYSETHIAEIALNLGVEDPQIAAGLAKWKEKGPGAKLAAHEAQKRAAALELAQKGESTAESLATLLEWAERGDNVARTWLRLNEAPGLALTWLRADVDAVDALRKLRPPEALAAVEQAAAREWDPVQQEAYWKLARWLRAYEVLIKPAPGSAPWFGAAGTHPGYFQSRGEPLSITAGQDGSLYVADVGNHRIQRFDAQGRVTAMSPGERTIDTVWFGEQLDPFVVGAGSSDAPGRFANPVYVTTVMDGAAERVVAIDAQLGVQVLDADLAPVAHWKVDSSARPEPGIGTSWPLLSQGRPGEVIAFVGKEAFVYDLTGKELRRFVLEAEPRAVARLPKRLLVAFNADVVVAYRFDGARDRVFYRLPADDTSEDLDLTVDELSRVILHTDEARIYQLDKKGRPLGGQKSFTSPTYPCRIAAHGGILYVTARDTIHRFELLE